MRAPLLVDARRLSLRPAACQGKHRGEGRGGPLPVATVDRGSRTNYGHDHGQEITMRTIKASEFKARCLKLTDEVAASGEPLVITKNGRPIVWARARSQRVRWRG